MDTKKLFLYRVDALRRIVNNPDISQLLELAGILRQLLLDEHSLIDVVNKEFRQKIYFTVAPSAEESDKRMLEKVPTLPLPNFAFNSVIPREEKIVLNRDKFLSHSVIFLSSQKQDFGHYFSVHDVIAICANKLGGVHYSPPKKDNHKQALMRSFNDFTSLYGNPIAFGTLAEIGVVVLNAIEPLYHQVRQEIHVIKN